MYYVNFDYVVTDASGNKRRVAAAEFNNPLSANNSSAINSPANNSTNDATATISVNLSPSNTSNQMSLILYGSCLDPIQQSLISLGLTKAFGAANQGTSLTNSFRYFTLTKLVIVSLLLSCYFKHRLRK
jgi:hypothetical protein